MKLSGSKSEDPEQEKEEELVSAAAVKVETHRPSWLLLVALLACFGLCFSHPSKPSGVSLLRQRYTHNNILIGCGRSMAFCRKRIVPTKISLGLLCFCCCCCCCCSWSFCSSFRPFWSSFTENTRRRNQPTERRGDAQRTEAVCFGEAEFRKRFFLLIAFLNDVTLNLLHIGHRCRCRRAWTRSFCFIYGSFIRSTHHARHQRQVGGDRWVRYRDIRTWVSEAFCFRKCEKWVWIFTRRALFLRAAFFIFHPASPKVRRAACP